MNICSAGNNFSSFTGHNMSFQIFLLVGHFTNWTGHNLLINNTEGNSRYAGEMCGHRV